MEKLKISPFKQACIDISNYLKEEGVNIIDHEVWNVYPTTMNNKLTRILNNKLNIHKINKRGERMNRYK